MSASPINEPVFDYAPDSTQRQELEQALHDQAAQTLELPMTIGGRQPMAAGQAFTVVQPHAHAQVLGTSAHASADDGLDAVAAARLAAPDWQAMTQEQRSAIFLKAAQLLSGPWRARLNAATMLGQGKSAIQAEVDAACELIDFWRWNVHFAHHLADQQPVSPVGVSNTVQLRPLEGFVYAITPFNFTAIAGNLPTAPALLGNVVVWKPSPTQQLAAHLTMQLLTEAGLPPGVINLVTGDGHELTPALLDQPDLAGIHFTGSTSTFQMLWQQVATRLPRYNSYPRLVGETGGKDFVLVHPSADEQVTLTALVRGAFEYAGQKCSAASRAYLPRSLWQRLREPLVEAVRELKQGPPADFSNFLGAVIDQRAFTRLTQVLDGLVHEPSYNVQVGGTYDGGQGWFIHPTVVVGTDAHAPIFTQEFFGPVLAIYVYEDGDFDQVCQLVQTTSAYGLTGAILAQDRLAINQASRTLTHAAGNLYINDKPTGAVVGQQPFGGGRASGTNDKAGSSFNLLRWVSPRVIKEVFDPPRHWNYPHQGRGQ